MYCLLYGFGLYVAVRGRTYAVTQGVGLEERIDEEMSVIEERRLRPLHHDDPMAVLRLHEEDVDDEKLDSLEGHPNVIWRFN